MKKWTEEEILYLRDNYSSLGPKPCAKKLQRSYQSVATKASKLGLKSESPRIAHNKKTHAEYVDQLGNSLWTAYEEYVDAHTPIVHVCSEGHEVSISPANVLAGKGCKYCSGNFKRSDEMYKVELRGRPFINIEPYIDRFTPILHRCDKGHTWKGTPSNIVRKNTGCPSCAKYGFDVNKPGWVYYVKLSRKIDNDIFYKIGVTNKENIADRFGVDRELELDVITTWYFEHGQDAYNKEQELLNLYQESRVNVPGFLTLGGNTELFETDVLELDND